MDVICYETTARHRAGGYEGPLDHRGGYPRALLEERLASFGWAANTINTYLARLAEKGFVAVRREGKSNLYTPLVGRDEYQAFDSRAVLDRLYGSPRNFVAALAREGMGRDELEELQALLDQLNGGQGT